MTLSINTTNHPKPLVDEIQKLLKNSDWAEAQKLSDLGIARFPKDFRFFALSARIAEAVKDVPRAIAMLRSAIALANSPRPAHFVQLARLLLSENNIAAAGQIIQEGLAQCGDHALLLSQAMKHANLLGKSHEALAFGDRYIAVADKETPKGTSTFIAVAYLNRNYKDGNAALAVIERGIELWPEELSLLFAKADIAASVGMRSIARAILETRILSRPDLSADQKRHADERLAFLNGAAYIDGNGKTVIVDKDRLANDPISKEMLADGDCEVFVRRTPGSDKLVVLFTGLAHGAGGVSIPLLHATLLPFPVNVIYLRDFQRLLYCNGVKGLASSYQETLAAIRKLQEELGARQLYCIGTSGGGYGAIRYGIDLGAEAILGFGAVTTVAPDTRHCDMRVVSIREQMEKHVPEMVINLRTLLENNPRPPKIHLCYGEDMPEDRFQANNLAGIPGTTLYPEPGFSQHSIAGKFLSEGRLADTIHNVICE